MSAMSTFFGVAEKETSEGANDGLYTDEQYQFDANGNEMTDEEIIKYLNENTNCPNTYWTRFGDWISRFFSKKINNVCSFVRYVKNKTEEYEEDYGISSSYVCNGNSYFRSRRGDKCNSCFQHER